MSKRLKEYLSLLRKLKWKKKDLLLTVFLLAVIIYLVYDIFYVKNFVVVATIEGTINSPYASDIVRTLDDLEKNNSVRAIVIKVNSPGGEAEAVHEIYYKILRVKERKPVVVSIDNIAASGAYYFVAPANYIFSKQSSEVGGVGVIAELPEEIEMPNIIVSGPFKTVEDEASLLRKVELLKLDFINVLKNWRKDKLKIDPLELTSAKLYIGFDAKNIGLVDEIGGIDDAIEKAGELAGTKRFNIYEIFSKYTKSPLYVSQSDISSNTTSAPMFYYLYVKLGEKNE